MLLPESRLPNPVELAASAKQYGAVAQTGAFLEHYAVRSEAEYKRRQIDAGRIMLHAQIGYRSLDQSRRAYTEIHRQLGEHGYRVDRYGICLDWSMGYENRERHNRPMGTGLILHHPEQFHELTSAAPVAPHFGDFVMGMPAALETTRHALSAGATSIGNLGQYFTFRLPDYDDDVHITAQTIEAIALCANQSSPILIHSNLDDGFAALFTDMCCTLGTVLLEQYVVESLLGGCITHCYGHTYSEPVTRLAFLLALEQVSHHPGTMVYGNTTVFTEDLAGNYACLGQYLGVDIMGQRLRPTGHAINPVPVTEALRIPSIQEVVDAHLFAHRQVELSASMTPLVSIEQPQNLARDIVHGAMRFKRRVMEGFEEIGIDVHNAMEMLLAMRRLGARELEQRYGPGPIDHSGVRQPLVESTTLRELDSQANAQCAALGSAVSNTLACGGHRICTVTTDVHEYGKILLEKTLDKLGITIVDGGVCTDPDDLVRIVSNTQANAIAISSYNGIALDYAQRLKTDLSSNGLSHVPVYIGGKLNRVQEESTASYLPVDISRDLKRIGLIVCRSPYDMLEHLSQSASPHSTPG